jgi:hypothetical protein
MGDIFALPHRISSSERPAQSGATMNINVRKRHKASFDSRRENDSWILSVGSWPARLKVERAARLRRVRMPRRACRFLMGL